MPAQTLTLEVPEHLYHRIQRQADRSQHTVEQAALEALASSVLPDVPLPHEFSELIDSLTGMDDQALWKIARREMTPDDQSALEQLHFKQQREALTDTESTLLREMESQYELGMLARAQAAVLLRQRGHDVSGLLEG